MKKLIAALVAVIIIAAIGAGVYFFVIDDTVLTYQDTKISKAEAEVYARTQEYTLENEYGSYLGESMWETNISDGVTLEDSTKEEAIETLRTVKVLIAHAEELNVSLDDEEKAAAKESAESFEESDAGKKIIEITGAETELIEQIFEENALANKVKEAIYDSADTEVSDEDASVKTVYKLVFATTKTDANGEEVELSDEQKAKQLKKAKKAYKQAKKGADFSFLAKQYDIKDLMEETYGVGRSINGEEWEAAVDKLEKGEITKVMETTQGYVVTKLISENDEDAVKELKATIKEERQQEAYDSKLEEWTKDESFDYSKDMKSRLWDDVTFTYGELTE